MTAAPAFWPEATAHLSRHDPALAAIIHAHEGLHLQSRGDAFLTLARSIVGQQISVKAAESVWNKVAAAVQPFTPAALLQLEVPALRACGLSGQKVTYVQDLARHFHEGLLDTGRWPHTPDEELIKELVQVKGIGRWTAEMFLIFHLHRPDVLPLDDVGLQRAMALQYNQGEPLTKKQMQQQAEIWKPYRSVATWYLWRSLDPLPVAY